MVDDTKEKNLQDLFGSQSGSDSDELDPNSASNGRDEDDLDDMDVEAGLFSSDDEDANNAVQSEEEGEDDIDADIMLPCAPDPFDNRAEVFYTKWPPILKAEAAPFSAEDYVAAKTRDEAFRNVEGTLRWWYKRLPDGSVSQHEKESNARFVRWSDGSLSLQIGNEMVSVQQHHARGHNYLALRHSIGNNVQVRGILKKQLTLVPLLKAMGGSGPALHQFKKAPDASLKLKSHAAAQNGTGKHAPGSLRVKSTATKLVIMQDNPEKLRLEAEKAEREKIRLRKRLAAKKRNEKERIALSEAFLEADDRQASRRGRAFDDYDDKYGRSRFDEYEKDDFVVSDEEEEEPVDVAEDSDSGDEVDIDSVDDDDDARAERLLNAKKTEI